jgi:hypothetical protein
MAAQHSLPVLGRIELPKQGEPERPTKATDVEPATLRVQCVRCAEPVTLTYVVGLVLQKQDWACPHSGCWMLQSTELAGDLLDVAKGHRPGQ